MNCDSHLVLSLARTNEPFRMLDHFVDGPGSWARASVRPADWSIELRNSEIEEILAMVVAMRAAPLPLFLLQHRQFELHGFRDLMNRVKKTLTNGIGLAVINALPMTELTVDDATAVYWVLGCRLS